MRLKRFVSACLVAISMLLLGASGAAAQRTLGWLPSAEPGSATCSGPPSFDAIQTRTSEPSVTWRVPAAGVITSWSTYAWEGENQQFALKIFRPGEVFENTLTALDVRSLTPGVLNTFPTSIPVHRGDLLGLGYQSSFHPTACKIPTGNEEDDIAVEEGDAALGDSVEFWNEEHGEKQRLNLSATLLTAPTITSLGTTSGSPAGGTAVTISGTEFNEVKGVTFGLTPAASYTVDSEGQITATAPPGDPGAVRVSVTNPIGTATAAQTYTYVTPAPTPSDPSTSNSPTPPAAAAAPSPPALSIVKPKPLQLKAGAWKTVKLTVKNTGAGGSGKGSVRVKAPKGLLIKPERQQLPALAAGDSWTVSVRVKPTNAAKKKSTVAVTASASGVSASGSLVVKLKQ